MEKVNTIIQQNQAPSGPIKRISWGAVLAGVVISFVALLVLSLLGIAIGLSTVDPLQEQNPMQGLGVGAAIWWGITLLVALFLGGWVAGRLAGIPRKFEAGLHGALTWAVVTMLSFYVMTTSVGRLIGGATRIVAEGASMAAQGASAAIQTGSSSNSQSQNASEPGQASDAMDTVMSEAREMLRQTGNPDLKPEALENELKQARATIMAGAQKALTQPGQAGEVMNQTAEQLQQQGQELAGATEREDLEKLISQRTGKSKEEASQMVDNWVNTYQEKKNLLENKVDTMKVQAEQKAREVGDSAAKAIAKAALWAFLGILLSGFAGVAGGYIGRPEHLIPVSDDNRPNRAL